MYIHIKKAENKRKKTNEIDHNLTSLRFDESYKNKTHFFAINQKKQKFKVIINGRIYKKQMVF